MGKQPSREHLAWESPIAGSRAHVADDLSWVVVDLGVHTRHTLLVCGHRPICLAFWHMPIKSTRFPGHVENLDNGWCITRRIAA